MHVFPAKFSNVVKDRGFRCISIKLDINYAKRNYAEYCFTFADRQISRNRANINKIVLANLSGRLFIFYHGEAERYGTLT